MLFLVEEIHGDSCGNAQMSSVGRVIAVPVGRPHRKKVLFFFSAAGISATLALSAPVCLPIAKSF